MTAAEREIELGEPQGDGASLRTHLQRLYRATGRLDPRLIAAPIPDAGRPIWELFVTLSAMRRTGMGLNPLAMTDIEAYSRLTGVRLTAFELDTLLSIDQAALALAARRARL